VPRAGLTAESLVDAAADLVDAGGYESLTLSTLADRVGVRPPSLYKHLASLDDLRGRLAVQAYREAAELMSAAIRDSDDPLLALALAYRKFAFDRPGMAVALTRAPTSQNADLISAAVAVTDPLFDVVKHYGVTDPDDLVHYARAIRSAVYGFVALESAGGFGLPQGLDESFRRLVATLDAGLRAL
jgi:AcrR family transcriptional regulator